MSTPSRRTRSQRGSEDAESSNPVDNAPVLNPSRAGSETSQSPRRSARLGSPAKSSALPTVSGRDSSAYGGTGRRDVSEGLEDASNFDQALGSIRNDGNANDQLSTEAAAAGNAPANPRGTSQTRESSAALSDVSEGGTRRRPGRPRRQQDLDPIVEVATPTNDRTIRIGQGPALVVVTPANDHTAPTGQSPAVVVVTPANNHTAPTVSNPPNPTNADGSTLNDSGAFAAPETSASEAESRSNSGDSARSSASSIHELFEHGFEQLCISFRTARDHVIHKLRGLPSFPKVSVRTICFLLAMLPLLLAGLFLPSPNLPSPTPSVMTDPLAAAHHYRDVARASVISWTGFNSENAFQYPWALDSRVKSLEKQVEVLSASHHLHASTIRRLRELLPEYLLTRTKDGVLQFPDGFFEALQERFDARYSEKDSVPAWDQFLKKNSFELFKYINETTETTLDIEFANKEVVSRRTVEDMLNHEFNIMYKSHKDELDAKFGRGMKSLHDTLERNHEKTQASIDEWRARHDWKEIPGIQEGIKDGIREIIGYLQYDDIGILAAAMTAANFQLAVGSLNFMSPRMGAVVDPTLSSPTYQKNRTWTQKAYMGIMGYQTHNPPIAALERWEEAGDCWCASAPKGNKRAPSLSEIEDGSDDLDPSTFLPPRAQIAVVLTRAIHPTGITIDHVPRGSTLDIRSAPKLMELWAEVPYPLRHQNIIDAASAMFNAEEVRPESKRWEGEGIPDSYVLISRWRYDIFSPEYIQFHDLSMKLGIWGVTTKKVIVRAVTNWGQGHTCFYRIRLHGVPADCVQGDPGQCVPVVVPQ